MKIKVENIQSLFLGLFLITIIFFSACLTQTPKHTPQTQFIPSTITETGIQNLSYDLLKEVIPGKNKIETNKINIIFDCRRMNTEEFNACIRGLHYFVDYLSPAIHTEKPDLAFGLLQIEPFKSNAEQFNFWYIDRSLLDTQLSTATMQNCDLRYSNITHSIEIPNIYLVYLCNPEPQLSENNVTKAYIELGSQVTTFPLVEMGTEKESDAKAGLKQLGNTVKSLIPLQGVNPNYLDRALPTFEHEMGHGLGKLADEYTEPESLTIELPRANITQGGFPNCAPSLEIANQWWKQTGFVSENQEFVKGCYGKQFWIAYPETLMKSTQMQISTTLNPDQLYSPIQKYWICYNLYSMTHIANGECKTLQDQYGFENFPYNPA